MPLTTSSERNIGIYQPTETLETPIVTIDIEVMERNIADFADFANHHGINLRSHAKNHKTPAIARVQDEATDGGGIMCQKLDEIEVMFHGGLTDLYLCQMVVSERKLERLVSLAGRADAFATTVDCPGNIDPLEAAAERHDAQIGTILEVDIGYERTGVEAGEAAASLATRIDESNALRFQGILAFDGYVRGIASSRDEFERYSLEAMEKTAETVDIIEDRGVAVDEVKVGCSATAKFSGTHPVVTEINPGTYPFNDVAELEWRGYEIGKADCATTVLTTVVSKPSPDRVIVDAGSKTFSIHDGILPIPKDRDDIDYYDASEEHGWVDISNAADEVEVGDRLAFIPPRSSPTMNLHDFVVGTRDGLIEEVWDIQARGKVR